jgi:hypothetical protein
MMPQNMIPQEEKEYILEQEKMEKLIEEIVDQKLSTLRSEMYYLLDHRGSQRYEGEYLD